MPGFDDQAAELDLAVGVGFTRGVAGHAPSPFLCFRPLVEARHRSQRPHPERAECRQRLQRGDQIHIADLLEVAAGRLRDARDALEVRGLHVRLALLQRGDLLFRPGADRLDIGVDLLDRRLACRSRHGPRRLPSSL